MAEPLVRRPAVAGAFYEGTERELRDAVEGFLSDAKDVRAKGRLRAIVVPHAGHIYSGPVAAFGYRALAKEAEAGRVKKIIMVGVSHFAGFYGAAEAGADFWETPLGRVRAGSVLGNVRDKSLIRVIPEAHAQEHCLEVQLPFLQVVMAGRDFTICPILTGEVPPAALAEALEPLIDDETFFIASSDLSHYNPYAEAVRRDSVANEAVPKLDIARMEESGDACGRLAILTLMHIAKKRGWKGKLLDYRNSGDTAGPKDSVVGYGCYGFYETK